MATRSYSCQRALFARLFVCFLLLKTFNIVGCGDFSYIFLEEFKEEEKEKVGVIVLLTLIYLSMCLFKSPLESNSEFLGVSFMMV